jgi:tricorn protease
MTLTLSACTQDRLSAADAQTSPAPAVRRATDMDDHRPHAGMLRYPDVSATHIAFVYANDIWMVPREGGMALPLAAPPGQEFFPRFNEDGGMIAFVGNYDGNRDLYTISTYGGVPHRVTHHPASETLCDWTPDGKLLFFSNAFAGLGRQTQLLTVSPSGGLPTKLPVPYGANGAISADGEWLAYTPHSRDHRTWKRYRGGMATDIWLFNLKDHSSKKITDWEGTDSQPMWHGNKVYYLSDAGPAHRLNIWSYDIGSRKRAQVTHAADFDVKWPAVGPGPNGGGEIVYQNGSDLFLLDLTNGQARAVEITVPGARPKLRPTQVDMGENLASWDISNTGKRALIEARGDIWTLPAQKGPARNLTRTSGSAERDPSWSPDGQWIAYFSDATGEYELYTTQSDGRGDTKQLTTGGGTYRYSPTWSPDSKHIAFTDKGGKYHLHTIESGETRAFDTDPWSSSSRVSWSKDSKWLAYTKGGDNRQTAIWLYNTESNEKHQVTSGTFNDTWPTFDRKGDYLFFASNRDFSSPAYEDLGTTFIYANTDMLLVVPLRDDLASPFAPKSDEEEWGDDEDDEDDEDKEGEEGEEDGEETDEDAKGDDDGDADAKGDEDADGAGDKAEDKDGDDDEGGKKDDDKDEEEDKPVEITLEGFERRAVPIPVDKGSFAFLAVNDKHQLIYVRQAARGSGGKSAIKIFDLEAQQKDDPKEKGEQTVLADAGVFVMTADGKSLMVRKDGKLAVIGAAKDQKIKKSISTSGLTAVIDPRKEWRQLFAETWRVQRDFFYDPNMHGVDWPAMRTHYGGMIEDCTSREDVTFVIGELISELNVGHAYARGGGDIERGPSVSVGMLGADFALDSGAYRIAKIHEGGPWDSDARGPLSQPGVDVKEGDYLLAVDGVSLDTNKDPWAAFVSKAGKIATLTVSDKPQIDDDARHVVVKLMGSERGLRYRAWIENNRAYVAEKTDGRVGYIYVPNTGINGQNDLFRQFYGQVDKQALIIDERWNGGGQIPTRFIELLKRPMANYWAVREGHDWPWPPDSHQGPKCMLINGLAGSGGDYFPYYFRMRNVGKLIGMRTWGGLVGISGNPQLIDGGSITAPTFAFYEMDGTWGVEGHGVDPDIEVIDDPALMTDGGDPQLDAAIDHMLDELKRNPYKKPARPAYPDRSGMGVTDEDK